MYVHARAPWSCLPAGMSHMFTRRSTSVDVVGRLLLLLLLLSSSSSSSSSSEAIALVLLVRIPRCVMPVWGYRSTAPFNADVVAIGRLELGLNLLVHRYRCAQLRLICICIMHVWDIDQPRRSTSSRSGG